MGSMPSPIRITLEEYFEMERRSEEKHEYVDGVVIELSGATLRHSRITVNTATLANLALRSGACEVYSDVSVWIPPSRTCCYPDLFVICGAPRFKGERKDVVENPSVIIEVLSESTRGYDHDLKFRRYRLIPELKQYVLISQEDAFVEVFSRSEQGFWILREYQGLDAVIDLDSIGVNLPLQAVYRGVEFTTEPS